MTSANKLSIETVISVVALVLSVIATTASVYFSRLGARTEVLPTLVFVYSADSGWFLRNVGNGPALNVLVAAELDSASGWTTPTQLYPVPEGERTWIQWVGHNPERLAAIYSDAHNREYTSIVDDDLTQIRRGRLLPRWPRQQIARSWER